jgi:hypothetical protein
MPRPEGPDPAAPSAERAGPDANDTAAPSAERPGPDASDPAAPSAERAGPDANDPAAPSAERAGPDASDPAAPSAERAGPDPDADPSAERLGALLRGVPPPPPPRVDVLRGVQERLRVRSRGKFYADGWSTREEEPRSTYLVTALFMLVVAVALYLALSPGAAGTLP